LLQKLLTARSRCSRSCSLRDHVAPEAAHCVPTLLQKLLTARSRCSRSCSLRAHPRGRPQGILGDSNFVLYTSSTLPGMGIFKTYLVLCTGYDTAALASYKVHDYLEASMQGSAQLQVRRRPRQCCDYMRHSLPSCASALHPSALHPSALHPSAKWPGL